MVETYPFKGLTYNKEKIQKPDDVMSPPYDIISDEMQKNLYNKHPQNFVRLILGKINTNDSNDNNRYTRAKELYDLWQKEKILIESITPAIYPYKIEYNIENKIRTMSGFFILLKLDANYKLVKAHERTLSKPKADRLNLMRSCHSNLEPIQLLYIDEQDKIRKIIDDNLSKPIFDVIDYEGFNHKLWKLEDKEVISMVQNILKDQILFIADGHHRYQTAIDFAKEMREKTGNTSENAPFNFRMVVLANMFDEGLSILPTHRLIRKQDVEIDDILLKLDKYFNVEEKIAKNKNSLKLSQEIMNEIKTDNKHKFALYFKERYFVLTLKDEKFMDKFADDKSINWRSLDVSILHKIVLEHIIGINQDILEDHVKYTRVDEEAIKFVDEGKFDFSVLMNATKIGELKKIAETGEHMPQKSTYFLPKMLSGLVIYKME